MSLRLVAMVAKSLDIKKLWSCFFHRSIIKKAVYVNKDCLDPKI